MHITSVEFLDFEGVFNYIKDLSLHVFLRGIGFEQYINEKLVFIVEPLDLSVELRHVISGISASHGECIVFKSKECILLWVFLPSDLSLYIQHVNDNNLLTCLDGICQLIINDVAQLVGQFQVAHSKLFNYLLDDIRTQLDFKIAQFKENDNRSFAVISNLTTKMLSQIYVKKYGANLALKTTNLDWTTPAIKSTILEFITRSMMLGIDVSCSCGYGSSKLLHQVSQLNATSLMTDTDIAAGILKANAKQLLDKIFYFNSKELP